MTENLPVKWEPPVPCPLAEPQLVSLAREIAMGIKSIPTILTEWRLSDEQYQAIRAVPFFLKVLENETKAWEGTLNTENRTRLKAAAMFETIMPQIFKRIVSPDEALKDVIEGSKLIAKVADIGESGGKAGSSGEKFVINIDLGPDRSVKFEKEIGPTVQHLAEGASAPMEIRSVSEGNPGVVPAKP